MTTSMAFIDGPHLYEAFAYLNVPVDFKRLLEYLRRSRGSQLGRANYFTPMLDASEQDSLRKLVDWLDYNGFSVVERRVRPGGSRRETSIALLLAVEALTTADNIDEVHLFAGSEDYVPLVNALKMKGKRVTLYSLRLNGQM